jgi:hypothetical protein
MVAMSRRVDDVNHDESMIKLTGKRSSQPESEPAAPVPDWEELEPIGVWASSTGGTGGVGAGKKFGGGRQHVQVRRRRRHSSAAKFGGFRWWRPASLVHATSVANVALLLPAQSLLSQRDTELAPFSYAPFAERA